MGKHTPGPWTVTVNDDKGYSSVWIAGHEIEVWITDKDAEAAANARLIAAAPDLLEVAKRALAEDWCTPETCAKNGRCLCNAFSAAIAKAESHAA